MKAYLKELTISCIVIALALLIIWGFLNRINEGKAADQTDLYSLIADAPKALVSINRPSLFTRTILPRPLSQEILNKYIPDVYLSMVRKASPNKSFLFSFHPQGVVMYTKADKSQTGKIEQTVLAPYFKTYKPQRQVKNHVHYTYFADTGNRFFGYYHHEGIFVASYSKKLLEEVADRQLHNLSPLSADLKDIIDKQDRNIPMNIVIPADLLNITVSLNDSTVWEMKNNWLSTDLFISEGSICGYSTYPGTGLPDSLYTTLADTFSLRLKQWNTIVNPSVQIHREDGRLHFTECIPLTK